MQDGRGPETSMLPTLLHKLNLERPEQLIGWAYSDYVWARFAALAPVAFECAAKGDAVAQQVPKPKPLTLNGGNFS